MGMTIRTERKWYGSFSVTLCVTALLAASPAQALLAHAGPNNQDEPEIAGPSSDNGGSGAAESGNGSGTGTGAGTGAGNRGDAAPAQTPEKKERDAVVSKLDELMQTIPHEGGENGLKIPKEELKEITELLSSDKPEDIEKADELLLAMGVLKEGLQKLLADIKPSDGDGYYKLSRGLEDVLKRREDAEAGREQKKLATGKGVGASGPAGEQGTAGPVGPTAEANTEKTPSKKVESPVAGLLKAFGLSSSDSKDKKDDKGGKGDGKGGSHADGGKDDGSKDDLWTRTMRFFGAAPEKNELKDGATENEEPIAEAKKPTPPPSNGIIDTIKDGWNKAVEFAQTAGVASFLEKELSSTMSERWGSEDFAKAALELMKKPSEFNPKAPGISSLTSDEAKEMLATMDERLRKGDAPAGLQTARDNLDRMLKDQQAQKIVDDVTDGADRLYQSAKSLFGLGTGSGAGKSGSPVGPTGPSGSSGGSAPAGPPAQPPTENPFDMLSNWAQRTWDQVVAATATLTPPPQQAPAPQVVVNGGTSGSGTNSSGNAGAVTAPATSHGASDTAPSSGDVSPEVAGVLGGGSGTSDNAATARLAGSAVAGAAGGIAGGIASAGLGATLPSDAVSANDPFKNLFGDDTSPIARPPASIPVVDAGKKGGATDGPKGPTTEEEESPPSTVGARLPAKKGLEEKSENPSPVAVSPVIPVIPAAPPAAPVVTAPVPPPAPVVAQQPQVIYYALPSAPVPAAPAADKSATGKVDPTTAGGDAAAVLGKSDAELLAARGGKGATPVGVAVATATGTGSGVPITPATTSTQTQVPNAPNGYAFGSSNTGGGNTEVFGPPAPTTGSPINGGVGKGSTAGLPGNGTVRGAIATTNGGTIRQPGPDGKIPGLDEGNTVDTSLVAGLPSDMTTLRGGKIAMLTGIPGEEKVAVDEEKNGDERITAGPTDADPAPKKPGTKKGVVTKSAVVATKAYNAPGASKAAKATFKGTKVAKAKTR